MGNNCAMSDHPYTIRYSCANRGGGTTLGRWLLLAAALATQACAIPLELDIAITADKAAVISLDPALLEFTTRDASGRWRNVMQYVELALPAANTAPQLSGLPG
jgi:glycerophosphoryl diester phosphodiesterase